ncbi:DUF2750 domain-containing protein [Alteromonas sp. McT4-15]|uniref:DUF2750 domain-containing protein n=1 Tax=Alteromonas sp. McT4-15 TaxID=2881256 RepID=UPI001CF8B115|nr:DUF2750 domain-containing protein [Alteromonas sp. McT4-15]MCB4438606.1 DUF2750 domain-containing protein [Alteromonas sp. McT4-15]
MSIGAQIDKFYSEARENQLLWFAEFPDGIALEFDVADGNVSFPIWSSKSRILRLKKLSPGVLGKVEPRGISWEGFKEHVVPLLESKNRLVSLNLSGKNLRGFDLPLEQLVRNFERTRHDS